MTGLNFYLSTISLNNKANEGIKVSSPMLVKIYYTSGPNLIKALQKSQCRLNKIKFTLT